MSKAIPQADIVLVDDQTVLREPLAAALSQLGYQVRTASDGNEALELVEQSKPDLLLLDLAMPGKDGVACLRELRQFYTRAELPVIVLTAHSERALVQNVVQLGVSDFFLKSSFSLQTLLQKIAGALNVSSSVNIPVQHPAGSKAQSRTKTTDSVTPTQVSDNAPATSRSDQYPNDPHIRRVSPADLRPLLSRAEIETRIKHLRELKGFSPAVTHLMRTIDSPSATLDQIVEAAGLDQALATRFLWLANSAAFSRGAPVTSLRKAIVRIGTGRLREAAVTIGILERFGEGSDDLVHYGRFWEHSISVASAAAEIVQASPLTKDLEPDIAFTTGLMHDIGRLMLIEELGDLYAQVIQTARDESMPLHRAEAKLLLVNHAKAAEEPLFQWRFGAKIIRPITLHHLPLPSIQALQEPDRFATMALVLANTLAQSLILGESGEDTIEEVQPLADDLALPHGSLNQIEARIKESWRDLRTVVVMKSWQDWPDRSSLLRKRLPSAIRPRFLELDSSPSFVGNFFRQLFVPCPLDALNSWVVRADSQFEVRELWSQIKAVEERRSDTNPLPVVLLAGQGVDVPQQDGRSVRVLRRPYCMETVLDTLINLN
jgi:CheY-like chemotaxis protein/HD-like signal output (HDOD) protein